MDCPKTAFILGAGLGTRLRPRTNNWPKPLVTLADRPVITYAFDHLLAAGIQRLIINTHHCAHRYTEVFPDRLYRGVPLIFRHEPVLLDTAGGIKNIEDLLDPDEPLLVYNGDIVTDLPLAPLLAAKDDAEAILALRSHAPRHISIGPDRRLTDIRNLLGTSDPPEFCFAGIYLVRPPFFSRLQATRPESVIPVFLRMIEEGRAPSGVVIDDGFWSDIGTEAALRAAEKQML